MSRPWVLSDPGRHPYVDRLDGPVAQLVHRDVSTSQLHDPDWISRHSRDWDVVHVHLGLDPQRTATAADGVVAAVEAHRERGTPIAVTVHALGTPPASTSVVDLLRRIDRSVAAVTTLTARCADLLQEALDRPVRVIPHGPVLSRPIRERLRAHRRLHDGNGPMLLVAEGLPPNLGWRDAVEATRRTLTARQLQILVDPGHAATVIDAVRDFPHVTVATTTGARDEALHRAVAVARAVVVPWLWGGHSWLVELAADVGTPVVATDVGFLADQHPCITARCLDGAIDIDDLAAAMDTELSTVTGENDRDVDALALQRGYERLYRRLLLGGTRSRPLSGAAAG